VARATADDDEADTGRVSVRGLAVCTIADSAPDARAAGAYTDLGSNSRRRMIRCRLQIGAFSRAIRDPRGLHPHRPDVGWRTERITAKCEEGDLK